MKKPRQYLKRVPVKRVNRPRKAANHERAYGEKAEWIRAQTCCVCGWYAPSEAAHIGSGGTGRKGDASTLLPLCGPRRFPYATYTDMAGTYEMVNEVEGCHAESHRGIKTFEKAHGGISLKQKAAEYEAR